MSERISAGCATNQRITVEIAMRLASVEVQNFRCIRLGFLEVTDYTVLVGRNGTGKSSFLEAIEFFFTPQYDLTTEDFFEHDLSRELIVKARFVDLSDAAIAEFSKYLHDGSLIIEKVGRFDADSGRFLQSYHGQRLQIPDFAPTRGLSGNHLITSYKLLRETIAYASLPAERSEAKCREALEAWEAQHTEDSLQLGTMGGSSASPMSVQASSTSTRASYAYLES